MPKNRTRAVIVALCTAVVCLALTSLTPATAAATKPAKPTGVTVKPGVSSVTVTWKPVDGATSYAVCLLANGTTTKCSYAGHKLTTTTWTGTGLKPTGGTDYFVRVRATNAAGWTDAAKVPFDLATKPAAPKNVKVKPQWDSATITWSAVPGATSYAVCLLANGTTTKCSYAGHKLTTTTWTGTGLKPTGGTDYFVRVRATNAAGWTDAAKVPFDLTPKPTVSKPAAPKNVKVTAADWSTATVTWSAVPGATSYAVCLLPTATSTACSYTGRKLTTTTWTGTGLKTNGATDYYVRVRATNSAGWTDAAYVPLDLPADPRPPAATGLTHRIVDSSTVTFSWSSVPGATYSVCLLAAATSVKCTHSANSTTPTLTMKDIGTSGGPDWRYRVDVHRDGHTTSTMGPWFDMPVDPVTGLTATQNGDAAIDLSWAAATNARSYQVQLAKNSAMTSGLIQITTTDPAATRASLSKGTTYYYRVRGANDAVYGAWTNTKSLRLVPKSFAVTLATWNLCGQDKCVTTANKMKKWSVRKPLAGEYIALAKASIVSTQESHNTETNFVSVLPGFGTASYYKSKSLFYDKKVYTVPRSGNITLDSAQKKYAVWAEFQAISTGTRFIVVDPHLQPYKGVANDKLRSRQTTALIAAVKKANPENLPVVYAGDFNSNKSNADQKKYPGGYDAPLAVFKNNGIVNALGKAPADKAFRPDWNSANQAINPPLRHSDHVDAVYIDPRITVNEWMMMVRATAGSYITPFATDHNPIRVKLTIPGM